MYGINCDGHFIHSIVPDDPVGIGIKLAGSDSPNYIKFVSLLDCDALCAILEEHFPHDKFEIVEL